MNKKSFLTRPGILFYHDASIAGNFNATSINTVAGLGKAEAQWRFALPFLAVFPKAKTSVWIAGTKWDVRDLGSTQNTLETAHLVFHLYFCHFLFGLMIYILQISLCIFFFPSFCCCLPRLWKGSVDTYPFQENRSPPAGRNRCYRNSWVTAFQTELHPFSNGFHQSHWLEQWLFVWELGAISWYLSKSGQK